MLPGWNGLAARNSKTRLLTVGVSAILAIFDLLSDDWVRVWRNRLSHR